MQTSPRRDTPAHRAFTRRRLFGMAAGAAGAVALAACGGEAAPTVAPVVGTVPVGAAATQASAAVATTAPAATPVASAVSSPAGGAMSAATAKKVNANTASAAELQQAFEAAGVTSAARWVREVQEYRPYPTNDPSFAKLRGELAKYNPSADTVDKIIATLAL